MVMIRWIGTGWGWKILRVRLFNTFPKSPIPLKLRLIDILIQCPSSASG